MNSVANVETLSAMFYDKASRLEDTGEKRPQEKSST